MKKSEKIIGDLETWFELEFIPQSMQFMIDCLPYIRKILKTFPRKSEIDFLDVGTGSGSGANLLGNLYGGRFFTGSYKLNIDALELEEDFIRYGKFYFPYVNFIAGDIFTKKLEKSYDVVFSSHSIEHMKDPKKFVERLTDLSKKFVLVYAPYEDVLSRDHFVSITPDFAKSCGAKFVEIISSPGWYSPTIERKCIIFGIEL